MVGFRYGAARDGDDRQGNGACRGNAAGLSCSCKLTAHRTGSIGHIFWSAQASEITRAREKPEGLDFRINSPSFEPND